MKNSKKERKVLEKLNKNVKGITLVALVVTIIVLLILSIVVISLSVGNNGIFNRAEKVANEYNKQEATEKVNLKITSTQIRVYAESERMPTLQEVADDFCEDNEVQYVALERQKTASIEKIEVGKANSIFTKLKNYPYEFEIDSSLKLASINGIKLAEGDSSNAEILARLEKAETSIKALETENTQLKTDNEKLKSEVNILKNETILNKRVKLTASNFTPIEITLTTKPQNKKHASITLTDSIRNYKYLEFQIGIANNGNLWGNRTIFVSLEKVNFNNSDTINWNQDNTNFSLPIAWGTTSIAVEYYFKNEKEIVIASGQTDDATHHFRIQDVHGIK